MTGEDIDVDGDKLVPDTGVLRDVVVEVGDCCICGAPGMRPGFIVKGGKAERWSPKYRLCKLAWLWCDWCIKVLRSAMLSGIEGNFQGEPGWLAMNRRSALDGIPAKPEIDK